MKRTLLLSIAAFMTIVALNAQTVWNFGEDVTNWPVSAGIGTGDGTAGNPAFPVIKNGLSITGISTNVNMGAVNASAKTFTDASSHQFNFVNRFQFNGAGYASAAATDPAPTVNMPIQRFIAFSVSGNSTIRTIGITGSNNTTRSIFITDGTTLKGSLKFYGTALVDTTITYTGPAATLYIFCNASCNLYYLSATNVVSTSVKQVLSDKGVIFNGSEISNTKNVALEVYNVLGKRIVNSTSSISTKNFLKGVYVVRIARSNNAMKINI